MPIKTSLSSSSCKSFLKSFFQSKFKVDKLPMGRTAFDNWAGEVLKEAKMPDNDSMRFALATMLLHLGPQESKKSRSFFVQSLHTAAVKEVAHAMMVELKEKQKAEIERQKAAEEAAAKQEVSNEQSEEQQHQKNADVVSSEPCNRCPDASFSEQQESQPAAPAGSSG